MWPLTPGKDLASAWPHLWGGDSWRSRSGFSEPAYLGGDLAGGSCASPGLKVWMLEPDPLGVTPSPAPSPGCDLGPQGAVLSVAQCPHFKMRMMIIPTSRGCLWNHMRPFSRGA